MYIYIHFFLSFFALLPLMAVNIFDLYDRPTKKLPGNPAVKKERAHKRGPSFGLRDVFRIQYSDDDDDDDDDDTLSVASAPEEDYFAIRAYYDLEDGWDSRRSSYITGDYGRIVSRRVSQHHDYKPISEMKEFGKTPVIKEDEEEEEEKENDTLKQSKKPIYPAVRSLMITAKNRTPADSAADKNIQYKISVTPDGGHNTSHPSTSIPLALSFDFLAGQSSAEPTPISDNENVPRTRDLHFKEESNDEKQLPTTDETNPTKEKKKIEEDRADEVAQSEQEKENEEKEKEKEKELEKKKKRERERERERETEREKEWKKKEMQMREELRKTLKEEVYAEVKANVEFEVKKQFEERTRSEEEQLKNEALRLKGDVEGLKQVLLFFFLNPNKYFYDTYVYLSQNET
ncbi:hypothetical protein RFI_12584 [Reticulomyxa filosa]|uniref:Uncharacterized protein n=1 Tax=Reticulomyxa filosa TaxID=46433 RepID=X6NGT4_RETFI|nr:hypothetical protein RFI_12584 [Reticulomyxa filosa]|eukprot:ETO24572.1 hypothetical protein RFI_12584 [Reticulomyxa filosa]